MTKQPGEYLYDYIRSQPDRVAELLRDTDVIEEAARRLRDASRIFLVGTGTSYHGAMVGEHLLRSIGRDARAMGAFEFSQYSPSFGPTDGLILLSHRGSKNFSKDSLALVAARTNRWVAITGRDSALEGEGVVYTVPQERSPVITVSHLGAMIRLVQLATALAGPVSPPWLGAVSSLPTAVRAAVELEERCLAVAHSLDTGRTIFFVGAGPGYANAQEGALKVREAAYVSTVAYDVEGILHGPFVSVDRRDAVVLLAEPGAGLQRTKEVAQGLRIVRAPVIGVGSAAESLPGVRWPLPTHPLPEVLAPIINVIPLQWLSYHLSMRQEVDADSFRRDDPVYAEAQRQYTL